MKQSMLSFISRPSEVASSSRVIIPESIVIADSDSEDEFGTPPPPPAQPSSLPFGQQEMTIDIETAPIVSIRQPAWPAQRTSLGPSDDNSIKQKSSSKSKAIKKPHSDRLPDTLPKGPLSRLDKEEAQSRNTASGGESILCHQHRQPCATLLRCTFLKSNGERCNYKFCHGSLHRTYKQDAEQILKAGRNILGVDVRAHVGPEAANYLWKCPKCRGNCQCSMCRRKLGLEPLGNTRAAKSDTMEKTAPSTSKRPADVEATTQEQKKSKTLKTAAKEEATRKGKNTTSSSSSSSLAEGFARLAATNKQQRETSTVIAKPKPALQQQTFQRPLRKPEVVKAPVLESQRTRLPIANILERVWLYETLIRFDIFRIPRSILTHWDKFDDWTEGQVQLILEKLICRVADISTIQALNARNVHKKMVESFRLSGSDLKRGEAWEAARVFCQSKELPLSQLEDVELMPHQRGDFKSSRKVVSAAAAVDLTGTLLGGRETRSRRRAVTEASEKMKAMAAKELEDSDEDEEDEEKSEGSAEEDFINDEEDEGPRSARRSARRGRTMATRRSARQRGIAVGRNSDSDSGSSDEESEVEQVQEQEEQKEVTSESEVEEVEPFKPVEPVYAPPFETRIAILSGLVGVLLQSKSVSDEINLSAKEVVEIEKAGKEEEKELIREHEEEMQIISSKAPSMTMVEEYFGWKKEKRIKEKKHAYALLDCRVHTHLQMDAHKSRSGPLGVDADGNEYWQLSEYIEEMPQSTNGRWAWSLLVLGTDLYKEPEPEPEQEQKGTTGEKEDSNMADMEMEEEQEDLSIDGSFCVLIDVPAKKKKGTVQKPLENQKSVEKEEDADIKTPPPPPTIPKTTVSSNDANDSVKSPETLKNKVVGFSGTRDYETIGRLIDYIRNRLAWQEYEEAVEERKRDESQKGNALTTTASSVAPSYEGAQNIQSAAGSSTATGDGSVMILDDTSAAVPRGGLLPNSVEEGRRRKLKLREIQVERRAKVEALVKRLGVVKQYYQWHAEEGQEDEEEGKEEAVKEG